MNKSILIIILILGSNYAMPRNLNNTIVRGKCDIIYDNVYNYSVTHGYEDCEAQEMATAAFLQCKGITKILSTN
jgi:hypothetical protein